MLRVRKAESRGQFNHGWLQAQHSFSFGSYYDAEYVGFRSLRVINEDRIAAHSGFATHSHQNMEIVTYVIEGTLEHKDSMVNGALIRPGEIQYMSAGSGVQHSEFNPSQTEKTHLLQIWIEPRERNGPPRYEQIQWSGKGFKNGLLLVAQGEDELLKQGDQEKTIGLRQDAKIFVGHLEGRKSLDQPLDRERGYWIQVVKGGIRANGERLRAGDGVAIEGELELRIEAEDDSEFLFFDLR